MRTSVEREIGQSHVRCCDCPWIWSPKPNTATTGAQGGRSAFAAARGHGTSKHHRVVVMREAHYDYRAPEGTDR